MPAEKTVKTIEDAKFKVNSKIKVKDTEQIHICMGLKELRTEVMSCILCLP